MYISYNVTEHVQQYIATRSGSCIFCLNRAREKHDTYVTNE